MRTNLPITNTEYILDDSHTDVPNADSRGNITHVNQDFINDSELSEEKISRASQDIVLYPDMPSEALEDFWPVWLARFWRHCFA